jgi:hypothetical protein
MDNLGEETGTAPGSAEQVAGMLVWMREQGEETDWWKVGEPRLRR